MGRVYLAEHVRLGRKVALKMLLPELSSSAAVVRRFFAEARAVNEISHENIVEITDFYEGEGAEAYFIMELLKGQSLYELLQAGPLPVDRVLPIAIQMCRALTAAHQRGIIHRDVKPENVFLVERAGHKDFVKMLDFGIAKLGVTADGVNTQKTAAGTIMGTPEYMSPEQATGQPVDPRSDIYAFGAMLFEMVTGKKLFEGRNYVEVLHKHLNARPTRPGTLIAMPPALEEVILHCLEKRQEDRPSSLAEVEARLEQIIRDPRVPLLRPQPPTLPEETAAPLPRRRRGRLIAVLAGAGLLATAAAGFLLLRGGSGPPLPPRIAPAAAPATPKEVEIAFDSTPQGAEIFAGGKALGLTPFSMRLPREERSETFEFRLKGYTTTRQVIPLMSSTRLAAVLAPELPPVPVPVTAAAAPAPAPAPAARSAASAKKPVAVKRKADKTILRNAVVDDPFAE
jgi:serine/threonine-protein kinase